jgi:DNA-binding transcriptional LysR family regulator
VDRFDAMQAFLRVAETGSFTKAAEALQLSKTTVTHLVQQLETRLRVKLLHRTTRQVKVTPDGAAYYEHALRVLADMDDAEASLSGDAAVPRGRVRVDVPSPVARLILVPALPAFYARYPDIQVHMGVSDRRVDLVGAGVDCVLRGGVLTDSSLVGRRVAELRMVACAAPAYLRRAGKPAHPSVLASSPHCVVGFLSARTGRLLPMVMTRGEERIDAPMRHALAVDDGNAYLVAGLAGLGVLCLPRYMAEVHLASGELVPLFEDWRLEPLPMVVAFPSSRHLSAKVRVFVEWVAELMGRHGSVVE